VHCCLIKDYHDHVELSPTDTKLIAAALDKAAFDAELGHLADGEIMVSLLQTTILEKPAPNGQNSTVMFPTNIGAKA
jgi:hypothetical protein